VKGVGEPCAGEPHARFDGRGLETERYGVTAPAPDPTNLQCVVLIVLRLGQAEITTNPSKPGGNTHYLPPERRAKHLEVRMVVGRRRSWLG